MRWWCACLVAALVAGAQGGSVFDLISENPELSEFLDLVRADSLMLEIMRQDEGTVFAPTNEAMRKYRGVKNYQLLKYHLVNLALSVEQLVAERTALTRLKGSQPVFVTVPRQKEVFINNARIVRGDMRAVSVQDEQTQMLHIIDEVLEPTIPSIRNSKFFNPTALELMANAAKYDLGEVSIKKFYQKVQNLEKNDVFNNRGFHTYFIPIDDSFDTVRDRITRPVLDGHVIPNKVLFSRTMGNDSFRTAAFDDQLQVTIKMRSEPYPQPSDDPFVLNAPAPAQDKQLPSRLYEVQSTTLLGDIVHQAGSVLSKVVKPNIAVKNGVVHLIKKPLMVMDSTVLQFIQEGAQDRFHEFYGLLQVYAEDFIETLMTASYVTLFIPSNEAFRNVDQHRLKEIEKSPEKLKSLLSLHLVRQKVTTESVRKSLQSPLYSVPSDDEDRLLFLSVSGSDGLEPTLTVDGGGTNATVVVPDIGPSNGVIHIIDRILGIPYQTVGERLAVDPLASDTNIVAVRSGFSKEVKRKDNTFTLFVPSNTAWKRLRTELPSSYKALFSKRPSPHATDILQRHLVVGHGHRIDELARLSATKGGIKTDEGNQLQVEHIPGSTEYLVKWENLQARVVRANVECTNGYIHVIDAVLMSKEDVTSASARAAGNGALLLAVAVLFRP